jgi:hypothetical protein
MLDNGAYTMWRRNQLLTTYVWDGFYQWAQDWLSYRSTWAVIPDCIGGSEEDNDLLIAKSIQVFGGMRQIAPVWHMHESLDRLAKLVVWFDRVCIGSSGVYATVNSPAWNDRMNEAFNRICRGSGRPAAWIHMLRGMSLSGSPYPFSSVDSTDVARNHHLPHKNAKKMADTWDAIQCPAIWKPQPIQQELAVRA